MVDFGKAILLDLKKEVTGAKKHLLSLERRLDSLLESHEVSSEPTSQNDIHMDETDVVPMNIETSTPTLPPKREAELVKGSIMGEIVNKVKSGEASDYDKKRNSHPHFKPITHLEDMFHELYAKHEDPVSRQRIVGDIMKYIGYYDILKPVITEGERNKVLSCIRVSGTFLQYLLKGHLDNFKFNVKFTQHSLLKNVIYGNESIVSRIMDNYVKSNDNGDIEPVLFLKYFICAYLYWMNKDNKPVIDIHHKTYLSMFFVTYVYIICEAYNKDIQSVVTILTTYINSKFVEYVPNITDIDPILIYVKETLPKLITFMNQKLEALTDDALFQQSIDYILSDINDAVAKYENDNMEVINSLQTGTEQITPVTPEEQPTGFVDFQGNPLPNNLG